MLGAVLSRLADRQALGFGIHSADAGFGRVCRTGTELTREPLS
jgi:hypothetical protein